MAQTSMFFKPFNMFTLNNSFRKLQINLTSLTMNISTRTKLKELNIPEKPKRPATAYARFLQGCRESIAQAHPSWNASQIFRKVADDWKLVTESEKQKLHRSYKADREVYDREILEYMAKLTPDQKAAIEFIEEEKQRDKAARIKRKMIKDAQKPKRPKSPYTIFVLEQSKMRNIPYKDVMIACKDEWHNMSQGDKDRYSKQYLKEKEEYDLALDKWEKKMIKEGHNDLVRQKTLLSMKPPKRKYDEHEAVKKPK